MSVRNYHDQIVGKLEKISFKGLKNTAGTAVQTCPTSIFPKIELAKF